MNDKPTDLISFVERKPYDSDGGATESRFDDPRVIAAVQQFMAALESGQVPDRQAFLAQFPEIVAEVEECLDALEALHQVMPDLERSSDDTSSLITAGFAQLGDYQLLREIGRGGMGVVYEAEQISLRRRVAVKVLPLVASLDRMHLQRFRNEAQAAAQLHHTNIVPVYAVGEQRGVHFYAMQLIEGEPLSRLIARLRRLAGKQAAQDALSAAAAPTGDPALTEASDGGAAEQHGAAVTATIAASSTKATAQQRARREYFRHAANLMRQAAAALDHAHQFGVVHRDVKPANLLVDAHANLWVTDFGLAQIQADVTLTRTGDVLGTLRYMSPEQATGNRMVLDHRTDIYSLGVTFYELLTLEPVFAGNDRHALSRLILEVEPRSPRSLDQNIPLELETIVNKALAKDPRQRYATAAQLADDLQRWLDDKPILARPPTLLEQAVKWGRRHRSLVRMAVGFLVVAFLGLLASTLIIAREHAKTKEAYQAEMNERMAADESFRQARQAVDTFTRLSEEELAHQPSHRALRRKFLDASLAYYRDFLSQRRNDPHMRAELIASASRVEQIIEELAEMDGYAPLMLLADWRVREDLAVTPAQGDQMGEHLSQLDRQRREARVGDGERAQAPQRQQLADGVRRHLRQLAALVSPSQMRRLRQIAWQQQGPLAFKNPEISEELELSFDQQSRISEMLAEKEARANPPPRPRPEPRREPGDGPGGPPRDRGRPPPTRRGPHDGGRRARPPDFGDFDERPGGNRDDRPPPPPPRRGGFGPDDDRFRRDSAHSTMRQILATLSDAQRAVWNQLVGPPFAHDLQIDPQGWVPR
jgi:eukaryotic-like serine/threonine-protein kinase